MKLKIGGFWRVFVNVIQEISFSKKGFARAGPGIVCVHWDTYGSYLIPEPLISSSFLPHSEE